MEWGVSARGFTLIELMITMALIGILAAIGLPVMSSSIERNRVWTGSELVGSQIRQARLKAISRNQRFRVRFDCPVAGQLRVLVVTGDDDRVVPTAESIRLAGELPDASLVVIAEAGHVPHEEKPAAFMEAVRNFLSNLD